MMTPINPQFDIAFFSYNYHQDLLVPGLKSVIQNVPNYNKIILVWDDYVRERPIDFDQVRDQVQYNFTVINHSELYAWPNSIGQWGWIRQQLVKMLCFTYSDSEYTWICDGDVLVTGDPQLFRDRKPYLRYDSNKSIIPIGAYYKFIEKYFGITQCYPNTWVGSTCLFDNVICKEMFDVCLSQNKKSLIDCVQETIEHTKDFCPFSEFETYGNYCYTHHRDKFYIDTHNWSYPAVDKNCNNFPIQVMW